MDLNEADENSVNSKLGDRNNNKINTGICQKELHKHPMETAQMPNRKFECYLCKRTIANIRNLRQHMKLHTTNGKFFLFD